MDALTSLEKDMLEEQLSLVSKMELQIKVLRLWEQEITTGRQMVVVVVEGKAVEDLVRRVEVHLSFKISNFLEFNVNIGGGGYGTAGAQGANNTHSGGNNPGGCAGAVYGDAELTSLALGSGGMVCSLTVFSSINTTAQEVQGIHILKAQLEREVVEEEP